MKTNIIKIISSITVVLTLCGIVWGIFSYTGSFATADELNAKFEIVDAKTQVNQLSLQEYRIQNEVMYLQKRIWNKEDRLESCNASDTERKMEIKDDIRKLKQQLELRETELHKVRSKIESAINRVE